MSEDIKWVPAVVKTPQNPSNSAGSSTLIKKVFQDVGEVDVGEVREPDFHNIPIFYEKKSLESYQNELSRRKHLKSLLNDAENANQPRKRSIENDSTVPNRFDSVERSPKRKPKRRPSLSPSNTDTSSRQSSSSTINRSRQSSFSDVSMEVSRANDGKFDEPSTTPDIEIIHEIIINAAPYDQNDILPNTHYKLRPKAVKNYRDLQNMEGEDYEVMYSKENTDNAPIPRTKRVDDGELRDADKRLLTIPDEMVFENFDPKFQCPVICEEATLADEKGRALIENREFKSIPSKKFTEKDLVTYGSTSKNWTVQSLIKHCGKYFVLYEGWTSKTGDWQNGDMLRETASEQLKIADMRFDFLEDLKKRKKREIEQFQNGKRKICEGFPNILGLINKPKNVYWLLEDLTYYHNKILSEANIAELFYINPTNLQIKTIPDYRMITSNLVTKNVANSLMRRQFNRHIDRLVERYGDDGNACVQACPSKSCKCGIRFKSYEDEDVQFVKYNKEGSLDIDEFNTGTRRIAIECSDSCGCDFTCPTRQLQKGRQIPLAVCYERCKGYGVRAVKAIKKGQFVAEYTGKLLTGSGGSRDASYEIECKVFSEYRIDAAKQGNEARFFSHGCEPNLVFIEVHSRPNEDELLVPRCGVFALRDIEKAEELTVRYYDILSNPASDKTAQVKCVCRSKNCIGYLPRR